MHECDMCGVCSVCVWGCVWSVCGMCVVCVWDVLCIVYVLCVSGRCGGVCAGSPPGTTQKVSGPEK